MVLVRTKTGVVLGTDVQVTVVNELHKQDFTRVSCTPIINAHTILTWGGSDSMNYTDSHTHKRMTIPIHTHLAALVKEKDDTPLVALRDDVISIIERDIKLKISAMSDEDSRKDKMSYINNFILVGIRNNTVQMIVFSVKLLDRSNMKFSVIETPITDDLFIYDGFYFKNLKWKIPAIGKTDAAAQELVLANLKYIAAEVKNVGLTVLAHPSFC